MSIRWTKGEIEIRRIVRNNNALAGVVEALLLVALVAIILSIIQLQYIPIIMEQKESEHMDVVENQFSNLKSVIEIQSVMGVTESSTPVAYSPMSSPITLGSKELPYFISSRSVGQVDVTDIDEAGDNKINIQPMTISEYSNGIPLTSIVYTADNAYIDDRSYILEGGGIILTQNSGTGEVGRVSPAITVQNRSQDGYIKIYYVIPVFVVAGGKDNDAGYKDTYVRTNYSSHDTHSGVVSFINIVSEHIIGWEDFLLDNSTGLLYEYYHNGYITVSETSNSIRIEPGTKEIRVEITVVKIGVQVGAGIV